MWCVLSSIQREPLSSLPTPTLNMAVIATITLYGHCNQQPPTCSAIPLLLTFAAWVTLVGFMTMATPSDLI
jgi:hypothetical protein